MQTLKYTPEGICPNQIVISLEDGIVTAVQFSKGCEGNLQAVSRLVEGMPVQRVIELLK